MTIISAFIEVFENDQKTAKIPHEKKFHPYKKIIE